MEIRSTFIKYAAMAMAVGMLAASCKDDPEPGDGSGEGPGGGEERGYTPPSYPDDYRAYSAWGQRSYWGPYNVHDPSMEKDGEWYYVFGTDASFGDEHKNGNGHFPYRRSKDLVNWEFCGFFMKSTPSWVLEELNAARLREGREAIPADGIDGAGLNYGYWAPSVHKVGDIFRMYYSIFIDDMPIGYPDATRYGDGQWNTWTERSYIGWAEAYSLNGPWEDKGMVVVSTSSKGVDDISRAQGNWSGYWDYNGIDPSFIITPEGEHWLIFGSWHTEIAAIQLDPISGYAIDDPYDFNSYTRIARRTRTGHWDGLEGPEIVYNPKTGYYYLFLAYDQLEFAYNTRVVHSRTIDGEYMGSDSRSAMGGSSNRDAYPIITHPYKFEGHVGWQGVSHCAVNYVEELDKWFYNSKGRPSGTDNIVYCMVQHIHEIFWTFGEEEDVYNDWPLVSPERYAAVPQEVIEEGDIVGTWDIILLKYISNSEATKQHNESQRYEFRGDKTVNLYAEGPEARDYSQVGTWSYDAENEVLTVSWTLPEGNYTDRLYVHNALDWEATPRVVTIAFTGLTAEGSPTGYTDGVKKTNSRWGKKLQE